MAYNVTLAYRVAHNLCIDCSVELPTVWAHRRCQECGTKKRQKENENRPQRLCTSCNAPVFSKRRLCDGCGGGEDNAASIRRRVKKWIEQGMCADCGKRPPMESMLKNEKYRLCEPCYFQKVSRVRLGTRKHWIALKQKLEEQEYRCAYTGELLILGVNDSLDHIYPASKYPEMAHDPANTEWVTRAVNEMKRDRTPDEFLALMHHIIEYREK